MVKAGTHAVAQGVMSLAQGGNFSQAFIAGAFGSLGAAAWTSTMNAANLSQFAQSTVGMVSFGAISGGVGSALSGGNFFEGALIGGVVAGLNDAMHKAVDPPKGIRLEFDGEFLRIYNQDDKEIFKIKAVSGKEQNGNTFDYSTENQKKKNVGPIPEGSYSIDPNKIQLFENQGLKSYIKGFLGGGSFPGGTRSWGKERVWITPDSNTIVYGRSGFTIHGGDVYGSAGCIDLGPKSSVFFKALRSFKFQEIIPLTVKY